MSERQILSESWLRDHTDMYLGTVQAYAEELRFIRAVLEAAKCPQCDGSGSYAEHDCHGDEEACVVRCPVEMQCQWCDHRKGLIA